MTFPHNLPSTQHPASTSYLSFIVLVCRDPTFRLSRIKTLINEAERDLYRLKGDYISQNATNNSGIKDAERRYKKGEMRVKLYRHMLNNYESARKTSLLIILL